jgi:Na+/H+ antiporter NhaD/arsenite permease-like protein
MLAVAIFGAAYLGIALGRIPGLAIDRVGVALLGAIAMVVSGVVTLEGAVAAIHLPTILLLYALMILSAQLRLGGFYTWVAVKIVSCCDRPRIFLGMVMGVSAVLSALLANDIVCFALTPVLAVALLKASLNPVPFLIGLAVSSNIGSAATIIGNPQNMLIGQTGNLDFALFFFWCAPPSVLALAAAYGIILWMFRGRFQGLETSPGTGPMDPGQPFDPWQTAKGVLAVGVLVLLFLTPVPREYAAMSIAGVLLCSRKMKTRAITGLVDWHLITLFCALFIIIHGISHSGYLEWAMAGLAGMGLHLTRLPVLDRDICGIEQPVQQCAGGHAAHLVSGSGRSSPVVYPGGVQHLCRQSDSAGFHRQPYCGGAGPDLRHPDLIFPACRRGHSRDPDLPGGIDPMVCDGMIQA